ncbi:MAG TPA: hypothetical protein DIC51_00485 [Coxiellaceae bacterium]|nr:hypothetical protein [Coxiellaceae bacterium]
MMIYIFAFSRIFSNSLFTLFQKKITRSQGDPVFIMTINYFFLMLLTLPVVLISFHGQDISGSGFWQNIFLASAFDAIGNIFLILSLNLIDLSLFGPLNAYKPIIGMIVAFFLIHEIPTLAGLIGVIIISIGAYVLTWKSKKNKNISVSQFLSSKGFWFRMLSSLLFVVAAIFTKVAIQKSNPFITMLFWSIFGFPVVLPIALIQKKSQWLKNIMNFRNQKFDYLIMFLFMFLMQLFTLLTYGKLLVSYSLAFFQLASVLTVLYGYLFFNEKHIKSRLIGSIIMILGVLLIGLNRI